MTDWHVHVGQWHGTYYDPAAVVRALKDMTEGERDALRVGFPFPGGAGTAEGAREKELRRRRHPRRSGSLREFIEDPKDSE